MKVIVTGASQGIGHGIATVLGKNGFHVGLLARSQNLLEELASSIKNNGGQSAISACDIRDHYAVQKSIDSLVEQMNGVDALINNAGVVIVKDIFTLTLDEWHNMIETNVNGLFYATRAVLPYLNEQQKGHIINISSISGHMPLAGGSGYAASKYAVTGFSVSLLHEVRNHNIKVTTVFPGSVDSASHRHDSQADHAWKVTPEEVGESCLHILQTSPKNCISELEIRPLNKNPG